MNLKQLVIITLIQLQLFKYKKFQIKKNFEKFRNRILWKKRNNKWILKNSEIFD